MMEIILGVVMFTLIVLVLSGLILAARAKLVNSGDVVIDINDDPQNQIRAPAGDKLLNALSGKGNFRLLGLRRRRLLRAVPRGGQRGRRRYSAHRAVAHHQA